MVRRMWRPSEVPFEIFAPLGGPPVSQATWSSTSKSSTSQSRIDLALVPRTTIARRAGSPALRTTYIMLSSKWPTENL
jgi:hypothetical protein